MSNPSGVLADILAKNGITPQRDEPTSVRSVIESLEPGVLHDSVEETETVRTPASSSEVVRPNGQVYHTRTLAGQVDVEVLRELRSEQVTLLLSGYPGSGKTSLVEAAFGEAFEIFAGHGEAEIGDLVGSYVQMPDGSFVWNDGPLPRAMKRGVPLFVDDATLTPSGVLARLYPAMDGRGVIVLTEHEGESIHAAPGFYVVGAHNPGVPGAVLSEALASRFAVHLNVPTDLELARDLGVESVVVDVAKAMQAKREKGEVLWAPEMRELLAYLKIKKILGRTPALQNLVSLCPESDRDEFGKLIGKHLPNVTPLTLNAAKPAK